MLDITIDLMEKKETNYPYSLKDILNKPGLYEDIYGGDGFILISENGNFFIDSGTIQILQKDCWKTEKFKLSNRIMTLTIKNR